MWDSRRLKIASGINRFTMFPTKQRNYVNSIGITSKSGKHDGGTYANFDIAMDLITQIILIYFNGEFFLKSDTE